MDISCYSFTAVAQRAEKMMKNGGSLVTLTYYGSEKVMPHYNVMGVAKAALEASVRYMAEDLGKRGIRVNSISAGPIKTLAASGVGDFRYILKWNELNAPLRRTVTIDEVGNSALYLCSDMGRAVTGECLHVDAGYHVVGMKAEDAPDIAVAPKEWRLSFIAGITLYLARHGETEANVGMRFSGKRDTPLTAKGLAQAHALGEILKREVGMQPKLYFVSSPLARARLTMEIVLSVLGLPEDGYATDPRIQEIDLGDWDQLTKPEARALDPALFDARAADKWNVHVPGGENYEEVAARASDWV